MTLLAQLAALVAIVSTGVVYGTDAFCAAPAGASNTTPVTPNVAIDTARPIVPSSGLGGHDRIRHRGPPVGGPELSV